MSKLDKRIIKDRIDACIESQQFAWALPSSVTPDFEDTPERNLALLKGTYWDDLISVPLSKKPRVCSNQILPKWQANSATVTSGETEFLAEALTPDADTENTADVVAAVLSQMWSKLLFDEECKQARWDIATYGFGVVEVGWRFKRGKEDLTGDRGEAVTPENAPALMFDEEGIPYTPEPMQEVGGVEDDNAVWGNPTIDDPFVERFNPRHLLVDRNTTKQDLSDCRSAFRIRWESPEALRADKRLKNTATLRGSVYDKSSKDFIHTDLSADSYDDAALTMFYDGYTWTFESGQKVLYHVIYTNEIDEILLMEPCKYIREFDGEPLFGKNPFPFRICKGSVVDNDSFYQVTKIEGVADKQIAFDRGFSQLDNYRFKSVRQFLIDSKYLDNDIISDGLESGEDGLLIPTDGTPDPNAILQVPVAQGSMDLYKELQEIPTEIGRALATNEFEESQIPDKKMLAREVDAVSRQGNSRTQVDIEIFDTFREDVALCVFLLFDKFGDRARYFNQKDGTGQTQWGQINNTSLREAAGASDSTPIDQIYRIKINASSTRAKNKSYEQEKQATLYKMLQPFMTPTPTAPGMPPSPPLVDARVVLRGLLKSFDVDNIDEYLPEQQQGNGDPTQAIAQALMTLSQFPPEVVQQVTAQLQMQQQQQAPQEQPQGAPMQ